MDLLTRVLRMFTGVLTLFAGYVLMAAEGWGQPLEDMFAGRLVVGCFVGLIGLWFVLLAFQPPQRRGVGAPPGVSPQAPTAFSDSAPAAMESNLIVLPELTPDETPGIRAARALLMAAAACQFKPRTADFSVMAHGDALAAMAAPTA